VTQRGLHTGPARYPDSLERVARVLWPEGPEGPLDHRVRWAEDLPGSLPPGTERYAAIPSPSRPAFLLPLDAPPRARARLLRHYNHLRTDRRRAQRLALAALAAVGLPRARGRLLVVPPGPRASLREVVADAIGVPAADLVLSVAVRPGTGPLTPTVTVVDTEGTPRVFVKVADTPGTRAELEAEHDVLVAMRQPADSPVLVPGPLFRLEWDGALVVGIEPLPLDVRRVEVDELDAVQPFLDALVASRPTIALTLDESPWTARLRGVAASLPPHAGAPLTAAIDATVARHTGTRFPHGLRHGDWSCWNMARSDDAGGLAVWDWEFSEPSAPLGLDRCNWHFAFDTGVRGLSTAESAARLRALPADVADPRLRELYLLDMAARRSALGAGGEEASARWARELLAELA
jgi:hypothetical protein